MSHPNAPRKVGIIPVYKNYVLMRRPIQGPQEWEFLTAYNSQQLDHQWPGAREFAENFFRRTVSYHFAHWHLLPLRKELHVDDYLISLFVISVKRESDARWMMLTQRGHATLDFIDKDSFDERDDMNADDMRLIRALEDR